MVKPSSSHVFHSLQLLLSTSSFSQVINHPHALNDTENYKKLYFHVSLNNIETYSVFALSTDSCFVKHSFSFLLFSMRWGMGWGGAGDGWAKYQYPHNLQQSMVFSLSEIYLMISLFVQLCSSCQNIKTGERKSIPLTRQCVWVRTASEPGAPDC